MHWKYSEPKKIIRIVNDYPYLGWSNNFTLLCYRIYTDEKWSGLYNRIFFSSHFHHKAIVPHLSKTCHSLPILRDKLVGFAVARDTLVHFTHYMETPKVISGALKWYQGWSGHITFCDSVGHYTQQWSLLNLKGHEKIWSLGLKKNGVTHLTSFFSRACQREILFLMLWPFGT